MLISINNMKRKIRSISISEDIDREIIKDSEKRGLNVSSNISRILYNYIKKDSIHKSKKQKNILKTMND